MTNSRDQPEISIITPTYYRPDLLKKCILSIQSQEFRDYEHIIFSDHCPYAKNVYLEFSEDKRIKFFENQEPHVPNVGAVGKNIGIQNANSNIIAYCDDDNVLLPNHTKIIWETMKDGDVDVLYTQYYHVPVGKGNGMIEKVAKRKLGDFSGYDHIGNTDNLCMAHTVNALERYGGWRRDSPGKRDGEDTELMKRFKEKGASTVYIDIPTCIYYARTACVIDDNDYKNALKNLSENQYYVF